MRFLKKFIRKLYHLIWFLSIFIIFVSPVHALTDISNNNVHAIYYYEQDASSPSDFQQNFSGFMTYSNLGLSNFSQTNGMPIYPYSHIEGTMIEISGMNFSSGDTLYLKFTFTFLNSANSVSPAYLSAFNDIISIYNRNNSGVVWGTKFMASNVSSSINQISYHKTNVITTFSIPVTSAGTGVRISWGDNGSNKIFGYNYCTSCTNPYFGLTNASYQIVQDSNSIIIDQNQTIIDQNNTIIKEQQETNEQLDDLNDNITNDDAPSIDLSDIEISDTPISDLLVLPLTLLNSLYNGLSGSCSNWALSLPFNHSILLECFTIGDYVGSNVTGYIDFAICLFMAYNIIRLFISIFDDITTLSDTYTNWVKRGRY